jgi:hypothetical protein
MRGVVETIGEGYGTKAQVDWAFTTQINGRFVEGSRGRAEGDLQRDASRHAPLAQSVERFHGKEEVFGSIPERGSACWRSRHIAVGEANCRRLAWQAAAA